MLALADSKAVRGIHRILTIGSRFVNLFKTRTHYTKGYT